MRRQPRPAKDLTRVAGLEGGRAGSDTGAETQALPLPLLPPKGGSGRSRALFACGVLRGEGRLFGIRGRVRLGAGRTADGEGWWWQFPF